MIYNATITQRRARSGASKTGGKTFGSAATLSIACNAQSIKAFQRSQLTGRLVGAEATLRVLKSDAGGVVVGEGDELTIAMQDGGSKTYEVLDAGDWEKSGGLSHFECFLKTV